MPCGLLPWGRKRARSQVWSSVIGNKPVLCSTMICYMRTCSSKLAVSFSVSGRWSSGCPRIPRAFRRQDVLRQPGKRCATLREMDRGPLARPDRSHARVHEADAHPIGESSLTFEPVPRPDLSVWETGRGFLCLSPSRPSVHESIENQLPNEGGVISRCPDLAALIVQSAARSVFPP